MLAKNDDQASLRAGRGRGSPDELVATGSYGCASDEGDTFDGAVADAEAFCEARGCVGLLIESGADPCAEPHDNATFTGCRRMLGPTVQPVRNCFYCPGPSFDCGMAGDART